MNKNDCYVNRIDMKKKNWSRTSVDDHDLIKLTARTLFMEERILMMMKNCDFDNRQQLFTIIQQPLYMMSFI